MDAAQPRDWARPIEKANLSDAAYRAIRAALAEGRLRPGEPLPLRPMSQRFKISVTPMREALLRLVSERALSMDARGTAVVPALTRARVQEIGDLRSDLEGRAAALAAVRAQAAEIAALAAVNEEVVAAHAARDIPGAVRANTRFHLRLCGLARSPILLELVESLWIRCGPILWHAIDARSPRWRPGPHLDALAALREGDPESARDAMRVDAARWVRDYIKFAAPDP
ncbi:MAG: GntR family transcriptional regulator [Paracoccaceae bacterium]